MRIKFTTTLDEQIVEKLKIEAIRKKVGSNDILEDLLNQYFNNPSGIVKTQLYDDEWKKIEELLQPLNKWACDNIESCANEATKWMKLSEEKMLQTKLSYDREDLQSWENIQKLKDLLDKLKSVEGKQ